MGDFDRFEKTNQGGDSKKLATVVALGALLLGLVGYQLVKRGPQQASGEVIPSAASEAPAFSETPAALRAALEVNPTEGLLRADGTAEAAPRPMRNPFRMASAWLAVLNPPTPVRPTFTQVTPVKPSTPVTPRADPIPLRAEDFKLNSLVTTGSGMAAIINGKVVHAGDVIGKARVLEISGEEVTLQNVDFPELPATIISMQRKLNN